MTIQSFRALGPWACAYRTFLHVTIYFLIAVLSLNVINGENIHVYHEKGWVSIKGLTNSHLNVSLFLRFKGPTIACTHLGERGQTMSIAYKGPATRCDAAHLRWDVLKPPRCIKIACDALQCIFQHVGNFSPDFGISQLYIVRFSNGFQQNDGHL